MSRADRQAHTRTRALLVPLSLAALLGAMPAFDAAASGAQADEGPTGTTAVVVVRGQATPDRGQAANLVTGTAGSTMDVPFSIGSVDAELVRDQAGTTLHDALRNVPGAQPDSGFNGSHTQFFSLRGAVADSGTGSNRILRDGVRLSNYPYVPAFVDSVDVLRGPGAAIGVRSEPGGTVNIVTRQPFMRDASTVLVSAGTQAARETTVDLNRVISRTDGVAARLVATRSRASEWRHVTDRLDGIKLGIAKDGGKRYQLRAVFEATSQVYRPDYGIPADGSRPAAVPRERQLGEPFGDSTTDNRIADLHADFALADDTHLRADFTHLEAHSTSIKNALSGSPLAGMAPGTYARATSWEPDTRRRIDSAGMSLAGVRRLGGIAHRLYAAVEYYTETLDQPTLSFPASASPSINIFTPIYGRVTPPATGVALARSLTVEDLATRSASLQDQVDLGAWSVVGGLRYTGQRFVYGAAGVQPVDEGDWSPKLGLLYRASGAASLYANLATGLAPNQVASSSNRSLPSRKADQAEAGWKSLWLAGALNTELAIYALKQTNMISADQSTPGNNFDFTVDGSARSRGVEAAVHGQFDEHIDVALAYAYTDARYLRNAVYGGKRVPNVARHAVTLWGQYRWDDRWQTGAGIYAQGPRFADEANGTVLPGYMRLDLTQAWVRKLRGATVEVRLALRNALDQRYFVSSHLHVSRWIMPGEGRNASLTGAYRF